MQFHRISSAELSRRTLVPKQTICDWLAGVPPENIQQLKAISNFLSLSVDDLCFAENFDLHTPMTLTNRGPQKVAEEDCNDPSAKGVDTSKKLNNPYPTIYLKEELTSLLNFKNWTCSELSRQTGVPKQTIHNWLKGRIPRRIQQLKLVAQSLNVTLDELCFRIPPDVAAAMNVNADLTLSQTGNS
jgi:transcriptional regulator with XRE-family HTH domain